MPPSRSRLPGCFWAVFLLLGLAIFGMFTWAILLPVLRADFFFVETTCTVLDKRLVNGEDNTSRPEIHIEYKVDGVVHRIWTYDAAAVFTNDNTGNAGILAGFQTGRQYPCWYDPGAPDKAVLVRGFSWWMLMCLIPLLFIAIGTGGLIYNARHPAPRPDPSEEPIVAGAGRTFTSIGCVLAGGFLLAGLISFGLFFTLAAQRAPVWAIGLSFFAPFLIYIVILAFLGRRLLGALRQRMPSPERLAAREARQRSRLGDSMPKCITLETPRPVMGNWPTVPALPNATEPGTTLAVRLQPSGPPAGCILGCLVPLTALCLGLGGPFWVGALRDFVQGQPGVGLLVFLSIVMVIGIALLGGVVVFSARALAGRVIVEVSAQPLCSGSRYEVWAAQQGGVPLRNARIQLVCEESATYRQGTTTNTSKRQVFSHEVLNPQTNLTSDELVGGVRRPLEIPWGAMHSFEAEHNKINWKIEVVGRVGFMPVRVAFPVIVLPATEGRDEPS
jgi:hypothetical protein